MFVEFVENGTWNENLLQNIFLAFFMLHTLNIRITIAVVPPTTLNRCTVMLRHTEYVSQSGTGPELIPIGSIFWQVSHLWFVLGKRSRSRVSQCAHLQSVHESRRGNFSVLAMEFSGNHVKRKRKRGDRYPAVMKTTPKSRICGVQKLGEIEERYRVCSFIAPINRSPLFHTSSRVLLSRSILFVPCSRSRSPLGKSKNNKE